MGCDIHTFIEVKKDGEWEHYDWRKEFQDGIWEDGSPNYDYDKIFESPYYIGRYYSLFGLLANVRNGHGFAGIDTGDGVIPIGAPKGLPDDVSPEVWEESDSWGVDGHSHSWHLLSDLINYDWDKKTSTRGWVDAQQYIQYKVSGKPEGWCGGVTGPNIRHVEQSEMDKLIQTGDTKDVYTQIEWTVEYRDMFESFFETIEHMKTLGDPDDVRLVFFFDN